MSREQELRSAISELHKELSEIQDRQAHIENKRLLGKCYRYRNSYSSSDSWWLYRAIVGIEDGSPVFFDFQIDCHGVCEVKRHISGSLSLGWQSMTSKDLLKQWDKFVAKVSGFNVREMLAEAK